MSDVDSKRNTEPRSRTLDGTDESAVERFARRTFEDSVERIDDAARSRLARARLRALEELRSSSGRRAQRPFVGGVVRRPGIAWAAAGTTAAVALALVVALREGAPGPVDGTPPAAYGDLEWLAATEELELLEEDLEFYAWLAQQPELAPSNEPGPR